MPCLDFSSVIFQSWLLSATLVPSINYLKISAWWWTKSFLIITQYHQHNSIEKISPNFSQEKESESKHGRSFTESFADSLAFYPSISFLSLRPHFILSSWGLSWPTWARTRAAGGSHWAKERNSHLQSVILSSWRPQDAAGTTFCPLTTQGAEGCSMVGWTQVSRLAFQSWWSLLL